MGRDSECTLAVVEKLGFTKSNSAPHPSSLLKREHLKKNQFDSVCVGALVDFYRPHDPWDSSK